MGLRQRIGAWTAASDHGRLVGVFILMSLAGSLWAITSPLMSVPDEPAHTVKAVAVWRGEWKGSVVELPKLEGESEHPRTFTVRIPKSYASANGLPSCYAFYPDIPANCAPALDPSTEIVETTTLAGAYPPLYYLLVGWPSRVFDADVGIYVMRIVSALVTAALFVAGAWCLRRVVRWPLVLLTVALAATPEVYYLDGSINPNGFEIAAGFALWCSATAVLMRWRRDGPIERGPVVVLAASATLLAHTRSLSPLFAVAILAGTAVFVGWKQVRELLADRRAWALASGLAVGIGTSMIWVLSSGHLSTVTGGHAIETQENVVLLLGSMADDWFAQMVAFFGWTDTGPVLPAVWIWLGATSVVVSLAVLTGKRWRAGMLGVLVVVVAFAPIVLQYPSAKNGSVVWQGRYFLSIAAGVPVLAAVVLSETAVFATLSRRLLVGLTSFLLLAHLSAHMAVARRFITGIKARLNYFDLVRWHPPLSPELLAGLTVAVFGAWIVLAGLSGRGDDTTALESSADGPGADPIAEPANESAPDGGPIVAPAPD